VVVIFLGAVSGEMPRTTTSAELKALMIEIKSVPCPDCILESRDPNGRWTKAI